MAAPAFAFTISRAAEMLAEDEQLLGDLADEMDPEDGCLWIHGADDQQTIAFTPAGMDICGSCSRSTNAIGHPGGPERMVTIDKAAFKVDGNAAHARQVLTKQIVDLAKLGERDPQRLANGALARFKI